jgi:hypothetical protein
MEEDEKEAPPVPAPTLRERMAARMARALSTMTRTVVDTGEEQKQGVAVLASPKKWAKRTRTGFRLGECTHKSGLAGGFTECSACGVKRDKVCTHAFGFAGGFSSCTMCRGD